MEKLKQMMAKQKFSEKLSGTNITFHRENEVYELPEKVRNDKQSWDIHLHLQRLNEEIFVICTFCDCRRAVFTDVWAGSYDTLALTEKNEVLACGLNNYNQLGISKGMVFHTLTKSKGLSDNKGKWAQIAFGQHHALCLDEEGKVYAVGRAEYGRLGLGQASPGRPRPAQGLAQGPAQGLDQPS